MTRPIIGQLGRALGGIPVKRPQDYSKRGIGTIKKIENNIAFGIST